MSKTYLCLVWTNHVQVTKAGGKRVTRDEHYSELVDSDDLLSRILGRVRRLNGKDSPVVDNAFRDYHADVKHAEKTNSKVERTISHEGRKVFSYAIKPLDIAFELNGATYKSVKGKGLVHVSGSRPYLSTSGRKHSGLSASEAEKLGIVRGNLDTDYVLERIAARAAEIDAEKDGVPFSVVDDKPLPDKGNGEKVKKAFERVVSKPSKAKELQAKAKAQHVEAKEKQTKQPDKVVTFKPSKRQLNECERYDVDPFKLPDMKPKGMNNKIWKALVVANK